MEAHRGTARVGLHGEEITIRGVKVDKSSVS